MSTKSLQRSRKELEKRGFKTWIVEKPYHPFSHRREDMFNFADLVAIREDLSGVTAIQATGEDCQSHFQKILEGFIDGKGQRLPPNPYLRIWLEAQNRFFIWSWRLRKFPLKSGKRSKRGVYDLREIEFVLNNGIVEAREVPRE